MDCLSSESETWVLGVGWNCLDMIRLNWCGGKVPSIKWDLGQSHAV